MKKTTVLLRSFLFCLLLFIIVQRVNTIQQIKGIESGSYNPRSQYAGFYEMKKNTVDVLFLGSSHCYCAFSPQEFYDSCGIRSYNLGSSQQSVWLSYYWLKEALRYQKPSVVVLETFFITTNDGTGGDEPSVRKALDYMRPSPVKAEAALALSRLSEDVKAESFLLTNQRFHARRSDLTFMDFESKTFSRMEDAKGYCALGNGSNAEEFTPLSETASEDLTSAELSLYPATEEYLEKIRDLCAKNEITLLFVKTPTTHWSAAEHGQVDAFARANNIPFIDYNTESNYDLLGYSFTQDSYDYGHPNIHGSKKIASALGTVLRQYAKNTDLQDAQWENSRPAMNQIMANASLTWQDEPAPYLQTLQEEGYTVFMTAGENSILSTDSKTADLLRSLFALPHLEAEDYFCALVENGKTSPAHAPGACTLEGAADQGRLSWCLSGANGIRSVLINQTEYSPGISGMVIVVYDPLSKEVVDTVTLYADGTLVRDKA